MTRLAFKNPIALAISAAPWLALQYLVGSLFIGAAWFAVAFTLLCAGLTLSITWIGLPVLAFALWTIRGLADTERHRVRSVGSPPVPRPHRPVVPGGLRAGLRARLRDPATRRDAVLLVALWAPLLVLDTVAVTIWLAFAYLITLPIWYRYVPETFDNGTKAHGVSLGNFPNGPHGGDSWGFFVGDMHTALFAAGVGLVLLVLVSNYVVVAAARAHVWVTTALLRPAPDPLAAAKQMLVADPARSGRADQPRLMT